MNNWDFFIYQCFLTGASLPQTENKDAPIFSGHRGVLFSGLEPV